jgi:uncharacterized Zn finger protein
MDQVEFFVQGSAPEPYRVTFIHKGSALSAYCTCPAGENGQYCKHRVGILQGNTQGIVSDNISEASVVSSWLPGTDLEAAMNEVKRLEAEAETLKKRLLVAKKALAKVMLKRLAP